MTTYSLHVFHRKMETAVSHLTNLAKTIADVGNADEGLCRLDGGYNGENLNPHVEVWCK